MQPIWSSRFSSFGSQFAIAGSKQWSPLLACALYLNFTAILMVQQITFIGKSLNLLLACVVSNNFVVV